MKCPECGHNHLRGKNGMVCRKCRRSFILDPKKWQSGGTGITDGKFLAILRRATADGTRSVTGNELFTQARQHLQARAASVAVLAVVVGAGLATAIIGLVHLSLVGLVGGFFALVAGVALCVQRSGISRRNWNRVVETWKAREPIPLLLEKPGLHSPPPEWTEPDMYEYGAERLVLCERDILVDWLVRNGVHLKERALILSESGYPDYLLGPARRLLEDNPRLPVYLLHDATKSGRDMEARVRRSPEFAVADHPLTDLGLFEDDARGLRLPRYLRKTKNLELDCLTLPALTTLVAIGFAEQIPLALVAQQVPPTGSGWEFGAEVEGDFG